MDEIGEMCCAVEKWCHFVKSMTPAQRAKIGETDLQCMLEIPPVKSRCLVIKFMTQKFDPKTEKFNVRKNDGEISLTGVDVECIYGLKNHGLDISDIIYEEADDAKNRIPDSFVSKKTGNLVIDDLIADVIKDKVADDDFIRKVVLVLIGTVLAPQNQKIVPKQYYALVEDVDRIKKLNFNEYVRTHLIAILKQVGNAYEAKQWPTGNTILLQVNSILNLHTSSDSN
jgi:hypothetical protein